MELDDMSVEKEVQAKEWKKLRSKRRKVFSFEDEIPAQLQVSKISLSSKGLYSWNGAFFGYRDQNSKATFVITK